MQYIIYVACFAPLNRIAYYNGIYTTLLTTPTPANRHRCYGFCMVNKLLIK